MATLDPSPSVQAEFSLDSNTGEVVINGQHIQPTLLEFIKKIVDPAASVVGVLPPVTRYISPGFDFFVVERPPFMANIRYTPDHADEAEDGGHLDLSLPIPWTEWFIKLDKTKLASGVCAMSEARLFVRPGPMTVLDSTVYQFAMPNMDVGDTPCFGDNAQIYEGHVNFTALFNTILSAFWSSPFNEDLDWAYDGNRDEYEEYEEYDAEAAMSANHERLLAWSQLTTTEIIGDKFGDYFPTAAVYGDHLPAFEHFKKAVSTTRVDKYSRFDNPVLKYFKHLAGIA